MTTGTNLDDALASILMVGTGRDVEAHIAQRAAFVEGRTAAELDAIATALVLFDGDARERAHAGWLLTRLAQTEHAARKAVVEAGGPVPASPFLDAMTRRTAIMTSTKADTKAGGSNGARPKSSERGQQARAESKRLNNKRGPGKKITDAELVEYVAKVRAAHPEARSVDEQQYAYWVEGIAVSNGTRWDRAWDGTLTTEKPEPKAAKNVTPIAPKQTEKAVKVTTPKEAAAKQGAASKPLAKPPVPRKTAAKTTKQRLAAVAKAL